MKKIIFYLTFFGFIPAGNIQAQNLLPHWGADNISLNTRNVANTEMWRWGWNSNYSGCEWGRANRSDMSIRYCDTPTFHGLVLKNGEVFTGRFAQLRWDGDANQNAYFTLGYGDGTATTRSEVPAPIRLKAGKPYNFSCWVQVNELIHVKMQVTTDPTGADASKTIAILDIDDKSVSNSMTFWNLDFTCPATADYYLVFKYVSGNVKILYPTDINLHQVTVPASLAATNITKNTFTAQWSAITGASAYQLDVATDAGFTAFVPGYSSLNVTGLSQAVTGLTEGTTYYYRVRTMNDEVWSEYSAVIPVTTVASQAPTAPVAKAATNIKPTDFVVNWNAVNGAVSYQLDIATDETFTNTVPQYDGYTVNGTSLKVTQLNPNTTYYYRVRAFNGSSSENSNTISLKTQELLIFLMAGQSNMSGRGAYSQLPAADTITYDNILSLNKDSVWVRARHPLYWEKSDAVGVSMGVSFAKSLADKLGGDVAIGIVPCAAGGTSIDEWLNDDLYVRTSSFHLYTNLITRAKKATQSGDIIGMIWHQGESNAVAASDTTAYLDKMMTFFTRVRKDLQIPNMPIVGGEIGWFTSYKYMKETNANIHKVKNFLPYYDVASSEGFTASDGVHFTSPSLVEFGKRYAELFYPVYQAYKKNTDPLLSSLGFNTDGILSPEFNAYISKYTCYLPEGTTTVTPVVSYLGSTIAGLEAVNVSSGSGISTITVTSADGSKKSYTINYKINEEKNYTHLIINNDFDLAPNPNDCSKSIPVAAGINGWVNNAWRPKEATCKQFYGWSSDIDYTNLGNNSQGINANTGGTKHGDWAAWISGTSRFTKELHEFYQIIDKDALPAGTYKVQCMMGVQQSKLTTQRMFANNNVQYHASEERHKLNITPGENNTYAGHPSGENNLREMVVYTTIAEGDSLKLGIRTGNKKEDGSIASDASNLWGWFKIDYFRLTRIDPVAAGDADLANIILSSGTLDFSPDVTNYNVSLPEGTKMVSLFVTPSFSGSVVKGTEAVDVSSGSGVSTIVATALNGTKKTYTITYTVGSISNNIDEINTNVSYFVTNRKLTVKGTEEYSVYSINGVKVAEVKANTAKKPIDLAPGVYIVSAKETNTFKIIVK